MKRSESLPLTEDFPNRTPGDKQIMVSEEETLLKRLASITRQIEIRSTAKQSEVNISISSKDHEKFFESGRTFPVRTWWSLEQLKCTRCSNLRAGGQTKLISWFT